jgi:hypothetical protein
MAKKKTLETILNEDLKRFNEIGNYVKNLVCQNKMKNLQMKKPQ